MLRRPLPGRNADWGSDPRYQHEMLRYLARRRKTTIDHVLARELDDVASAYSDELAGALPGFSAALSWPAAVSI